MPSLTNCYGITGPVSFVDVDSTRDTELYVDPHAVRLRGGPQPFAAEAVHCLDSFLREVTQLVLDNTPVSMRRGERLLQQFEEPWETRLGVTAHGFHGHGGATTVGTWIWDALIGDIRMLVDVGVLRHLEDLPLFVKGVDRDRTSDLTTRIIFKPLARFTEQMMVDYPQFTSAGHTTDIFHRQVWNPAVCDWDESDLRLPIVDDRPVLLVPQGWTRRYLLMSAPRYYQTSVLSYVQSEQAVRLPHGGVSTPSKSLLKAQPDLRYVQPTNLDVTMRAIRNNHDVLADFRAFVDDRFDPDATDEESAA